MSADITEMILDDHDWFRRRFLLLADLRDSPERAAAAWDEIARALEVHAAAEEQHFYPMVKARQTEDILRESVDRRVRGQRAAEHHDVGTWDQLGRPGEEPRPVVHPRRFVEQGDGARGLVDDGDGPPGRAGGGHHLVGDAQAGQAGHQLGPGVAEALARTADLAPPQSTPP